MVIFQHLNLPLDKFNYEYKRLVTVFGPEHQDSVRETEHIFLD